MACALLIVSLLIYIMNALMITYTEGKMSDELENKINYQQLSHCMSEFNYKLLWNQSNF